MGDYTEFRVKSTSNGRFFEVEVKGWFMWRRGFMATDYFASRYDSISDAKKAIDLYKVRYTYES